MEEQIQAVISMKTIALKAASFRHQKHVRWNRMNVLSLQKNGIYIIDLQKTG